MICKHINNINRIQKKYVATTMIEWESLYKTQFQQVIDLLNKLNEVGFNHIVTEIQFCQQIFAQNDTFKSKEDRDNDNGDEDVDIDIVLDNDAIKKDTQNKPKIPANQVILQNNHNIKDQILLSPHSTSTIDQLVSKMYSQGRFNKIVMIMINSKNQFNLSIIYGIHNSKNQLLIGGI